MKQLNKWYYQKKMIGILFALVIAISPIMSVKADSSAESLKEGAWQYTINEDGKTVTITGWHGSDTITALEIPDTLDGKTVTKIGYTVNFVFDGGSNLTSITIPDSITSIGLYAFSGCSSLTSITIPDSVTHIGEYAFFRCSGLTNIEIPNGVTIIDRFAFYGCSNLANITIPRNVISIGVGTFCDCFNLTDIIVESGSSQYISQNGILYNKELTELICCPSAKSGTITIPDSITDIAGFAFWGCSSVSDIEIPNGVTNINYSAFSGCSNLSSITIPNSITNIGEYAFENCVGLTDISIPNSVTKIQRNAFSGCSNLTDIIVEPDSTQYASQNGILYDKELTRLICCPRAKSGNVVIPDSVTKIDEYAFFRCSNLTGVTIPNGVTSIGYYAFYDCSKLTNITIPNSVTIIEGYSFEGCSSLTSITIPASVKNIGNHRFHDVFNRCSDSLILIVDADSYALQYAKDCNLKYRIVESILPDPTTPGTSSGDTKPDTTPDTSSDDAKPTVPPTGNQTPDTTPDNNMPTPPQDTSTPVPAEVGTSFKVNGAYYKVTSADISNPTVTYTKPASKTVKTATIPATITVDDITYKVTAVAANAFKGNTKLTKVTVGTNVTSIGKNAFNGCKNIKTLTIKSANLKTVGKNAIKGINAKATIKVPKKQHSAYKKLFKSSTGYRKTMKVKK